MMNVTMSMDWREWDKAVTEYAAATDKTLAEASNRQMLNLAIHGVGIVKKAEASAIESLEKKDFWPKVVATVLYKKAGASLMAKASSRRTKFLEALAIRGFMAKGRSRMVDGVREFRPQHYTREQAREFSKKLIRRRLKAVGYMRFFFVSLGDAVKPYITSGKAPKIYGKKFSSFKVSITPATESNPTCACQVSYEYKTRKDKTAKKAERLLDSALRTAIPATIKDMQAETERRMDADARRYSAA